MRVEGWGVDGFGCLKDYHVADLEPGVTVIVGENEAGKSTLLGFLRAILFGFPDKRTSERQYPPLRGGRHGGQLILRDGRDALWTLERYSDGAKKSMTLRAADGREAGEDELRRLLGGVDAALFKSVFAFSLTELQNFATLDEEGVRDQIFSAGISGAGKSARDVIKKLDQAAAALLKQGAGQAEINGLVREINDKQREITDAERLARGYSALVAQEVAFDDKARELSDEIGPLRNRIARLEALAELHPQWLRLEGLRSELLTLPEVADDALPDRVSALTESLTQQRTREERVLGATGLQTAAATARGALRRQLERLGPRWDVERVRAFDDSLVVRDEITGWDDKLATAADEAREAEREQATLQKRAGDLAIERERVVAELPGDEPLSLEAIERDEAILAGLWTDVRDLQQARIMASTARPGVPLGKRVGVLAAVLAGVSAVAAGGGLVAGYGQLAIAFVIAAVMLAVVAVAALTGGRRAAGAGAAGAAAPPDGAGSPAASTPVAELEQRVREAAGKLSLPPAPSSADLETVRARLSHERTRRGTWDAAAERLRGVDGSLATEIKRVEAAAGKAQRLRALHMALDADWGSWLEARGLPKVSPRGALELLGAIGEAGGADAAALTAAEALAEIERGAAEWDEAASAVLAALGRSAAGLDRQTLRATIGTLDTELERRGGVDDEIGGLQRAIEIRLGGGDEAAAAVKELAAGDVAVWDDQRRRLTGEVEELGAQRDDAIEERTRARQDREAIEKSADIPRLQMERESLKAELAARVREYRVVATARGLIAGTLKTFVRERQPAVLARASESFAQVTRGRYSRVEQDEVAGKESVVVVSADTRLTPDQLSRGTAEQLYLTIRLALVGDIAQRSEPLPLIMDDCLVNFDPRRAEQMARLLVSVSQAGQCLLFTCHPETAALVTAQSAGAARVITMESLEGQSA